ncbi:hypothetical protein AB0J47_39955 [Nocardia sp. NPDC049737]|uniref:hypothetical protein n=1 Tax=Nocardia sp. NPDC049737 TaxID=3154358 RepID=UPI00343093F0
MIDESESEHRSEPEHQRSRWKNFAYRVAEEMAIAAATVTTTAIVEYVIEVIR